MHMKYMDNEEMLCTNTMSMKSVSMSKLNVKKVTGEHQRVKIELQNDPKNFPDIIKITKIDNLTFTKNEPENAAEHQMMIIPKIFPANTAKLRRPSGAQMTRRA